MSSELPEAIEELHHPNDEAELVALVRSAHDAQTPVYPIGGATSMAYGLPIRKPGWGIATTKLDQIIDYPAADMTITVQAGITMESLSRALAEQQQQLPLDVASPGSATLGGVLATNQYGHRRYGYGSARDYVIGIRAIDGRGEAFAGGGRVVKNVAGYDFCKLLVGSMGTLGIISEVTLKLKPTTQAKAAVVVPLENADRVEPLLAGIVHSKTTPIAVNWFLGPAWDTLVDDLNCSAADGGHVAVIFDGTQTEVDWSLGQFQSEVQALGNQTHKLDAQQLDALEQQLTAFGASEEAALTAKAAVLPSNVAAFASRVRSSSKSTSILSHAGNGIVLIRTDDYPDAGVGATVTGQWIPWADQAGGSLCLLHNRDQHEATLRTTWGTPSGPPALMRKIREQFDPNQILNPGRFVY